MTNDWNKEQVLGFLRKAGEDLRRAGDELRTEAQKLMAEVRDPANQERVREGLRELGGWLKRTSSEAAEAIEGAVKRAEGALVGKKAKAKPATRRKPPTRKAAPRRRKPARKGASTP